MAALSTGPIAGFIKEYDLFAFPFLFKNTDHFWKVLDGEIGDLFLKKLETIGIKGLIFQDDGTRNVMNSKHSVFTPDDLRGIRIRVMESPIFMASINAMGAIAVPMSYTEVYTALQQKIIDGVENTLNVVLDANWWEVCKFLSLTNHFQVPNLVIMNLDLFNSLSSLEQQSIMQAAKESITVNKELVSKFQEESLEKLKEEGVIVNEVDQESFIKAAKSVYDEFASEYGLEDIISEIESMPR